jgi:hypothetical protein
MSSIMLSLLDSLHLPPPRADRPWQRVFVIGKLPPPPPAWLHRLTIAEAASLNMDLSPFSDSCRSCPSGGGLGPQE